MQNKKKIPVLMYHEVLDVTERSKEIRSMVPLYCLPVDNFIEQMSYLRSNGYCSITLEDLCRKDIPNNRNYASITFDDGLVGNYEFAFPILKKFYLKASFFIIVSRIGTQGYMSWKQISELIRADMVIGSHSMTHTPLQNLSADSIFYEINESKKIIEDRTGVTVKHLSVPHGSIDERVIKIAGDLGYLSICTSTLGCKIIRGKPVLIDRIPIVDKYDINVFSRIVDTDSLLIKKLAMIKYLKNTFKKIIGIENYRRLYRWFFRIKSHEKDL